MPNPLLDALSDVGYLFETPGAYVRGALSGRLGQRATPEELLQHYGASTDPVASTVTGLATDPLVWMGLAGAGYGAHRLGKALTPLAEEANPLLRGIGQTARGLGGFTGGEEGAFSPFQVLKATGRGATQIVPERAAEAYNPWIEGLLPEERSAAKLFTSGPQGAISQTLRGTPGISISGNPVDAFEGLNYARIEPGTHPIRQPQDVMEEVVPYVDSALSRSAAPQDLMTYRLARQIGGMTPANAESFLGQTVADPSYMSTTLDPHGRFYGQHADPRDMLLDILVPKGGAGGYVQPLSGFPEEQELLMPRNAQMRVAAVHDIPTAKVDSEWFKLDPEGKPIPFSNHMGNPMFREYDPRAQDILRGRYSDYVLPEEVMAPDWKQWFDRNLQERGSVKNVLLEMIDSQLQPHMPALRRYTPEEMWDQIIHVARSLPQDEYRYQRYVKDLSRYASMGHYPDYDVFQRLASIKGHEPHAYDFLLRSFER